MLAFILVGLFGRKLKKAGKFIALSLIIISFTGAVGLFYNIWQQPEISWQVQWFTVGEHNFYIGILLNNLSVIMLLLVSFIAMMVHFYSVAYMQKDERTHLYWAYLGLFCAAMMALVIADNLLLVYFCWELVGFASYLLIGFWTTKDKAIRAAKKAFLINRIGDLGLLIAIMIIFYQFKTLNINNLFAANGLVNNMVVNVHYWATPFAILPVKWLTICGLCFCLAAMAKSAQFPFHIWLPDAMEGPTAVSSLIHAATMVAAGIFLLARVSPIFNPFVLNLITIIGAFTAFMAATIALTQTDIKKILAYSTISQLGFMMLAIGTGANNAAIFHLITHAFFKCLLFLAAGSVIIQLHQLKEKQQLNIDEQDINNMGGLKKQMPITFAVMLLAAMALGGLPFTSGYLSKDAILEHVFEWASVGGTIRYAFALLAVLTSWLTVFYISRLIFKVFYGSFKFENHLKNIHESGQLITLPMLILSTGCLFIMFGLNPFKPEMAWPMGVLGNLNLKAHSGIFHQLIPVYVNLLSITLIVAAYFIYVKNQFFSGSKTSFLYLFLYNGWFLNTITEKFIVGSFFKLSYFAKWVDARIIDPIIMSIAGLTKQTAAIIGWVDTHILDAFIHRLAAGVKFFGNIFRSFQSGRLQHYLVVMLLVFLSCYLLNLFL